ncbi:MAG: hypothetical protein JOY93_10670 [Acidobacteriales bacterium]|nr:hypothetical protein [Terriglobales bacterium]
MLERAVGMDPTYAPAWAALGLRYYFDSVYSSGGEAMYQRSNTALERAVALDPNLIFAAGQLIVNRVERGELVKAYGDAKTLVERHPENAAAHFALSYVLRYGGADEESAHECETALSLDPGSFGLRSCAIPFEQLGNFSRAFDFIQLDAGSVWSSNNMVRYYLREGKLAQAREANPKPGTDRSSEMMTACLDSPSSASTAALVREYAAWVGTSPDPEMRYTLAPNVLFCGQRDLAFGLLRSAIVTGHYCGYDGLRNDPLFASLRGRPEFNQLLSAAKQCKSDFLSQTSHAAR